MSNHSTPATVELGPSVPASSGYANFGRYYAIPTSGYYQHVVDMPGHSSPLNGCLPQDKSADSKLSAEKAFFNHFASHSPYGYLYGYGHNSAVDGRLSLEHQRQLAFQYYRQFAPVDYAINMDNAAVVGTRVPTYVSQLFH